MAAASREGIGSFLASERCTPYLQSILRGVKILPRARLSTIRTSFQFKIFFIFTILTAFISCIFITLHILDKISETRRHATKEVHLLARQLADSVRLPLYAENRDLLRQFAEQSGRVPEIRSVTISTMDGRVLADIRPPAGSSPAQVIGETVEVRSLPVGIPMGEGLTDGKNDSSALIGTVRIERGTDDLKRTIRQDVVLSCLLAVLFWLAVALLSFLVLRRTTRSYNALVRGVMMMQGGDYASRIDMISNDEPGRAALAINELAKMLQLREEENLRLNEKLVTAVETEVRARVELSAANRSLEAEIVDRIHAEQIVRKSEQNLRNLMDIMPVGVVWTDLGGTVEYVNEFFVECFGYGREEIPTLAAWFLLSFLDPDYREQVVESQRDALAGRRNAEIADLRPYEARVTCKGGGVRHVLFFNQISGNRTIIILIDITDRESMQEQSVKVQKLESLGVLAGGIAHNFNNALTGVMGFISLARNVLGESHRASQYLQHAEKASMRAAGMAKQLLTFASGGAPVKKPLSLQKVVEEVALLALNVPNVRCVLEMQASLPLVRGDEGQLIQALGNIFINAMQAMPDGGVIAIRGENGARACGGPDHPPDARYVSLSISDQGHGISDADLPKIFDPYFTNKQTNTGLGLASVHSIVYRHGGHVSVTSRVGKGTTFTLCLPSCKEVLAPEGDAGDRLCGTRQGSGSVLIMDDDPVVREFSRETLRFLGYQATTCADGNDAVALYESNIAAGSPFMAVILDLTVPGAMGGVEAAQRILAIDPKAKLIVSSGYSYDPVMAGYQNHGFCAAVAKPYRADELGRELSLLR